jgi:DNA-binding NtrC family response regulator
VNCPNFQDTLLESELFGHEKGAFTHAFQARTGKIEVAEGGSLLLEEIGDLSEAIQARLLGFLDSRPRTFCRVGASNSRKADVRIIASTNKDLLAEVEAGRFRSDLFYRLNGISLRLPALRDRREDIPLLVAHFVRLLGERERKPSLQVSDEAMEILLDYDWPGNVRQLENQIEQAIVLCNDTVIRAKDIRILRLDNDSPQKEHAGNYHQLKWESDKRIIEDALRRSGGSQRKAAKMLGLNETYLAKLIKKYGIKK